MKLYKVTDEAKKQALAEFEKKLEDIKLKFEKDLNNNKTEFSINEKFSLVEETKDKAEVVFSPMAYCKMISLITNCDGEVAWHGIVTKAAKGMYWVDDILMFKQYATGGTVTTDDKEYAEWNNSLTDEIYNAMRFHGHSHVNFDPHPSGTDLKHREDVIANNESFYIFMIWNKKLEFTAQIFDLEDNLIYDTEDVSVDIATYNESVSDFIATAKELVEKPKKVYRQKDKNQKSLPLANDWYWDEEAMYGYNKVL